VSPLGTLDREDTVATTRVRRAYERGAVATKLPTFNRTSGYDEVTLFPSGGFFLSPRRSEESANRSFRILRWFEILELNRALLFLTLFR
jgi:hypothetical protein